MHRIVRNISFVVLLLLNFPKIGSQVVINEFLASNSSVNIDTTTGKYSDWIELHNSGSAQINLKGYYITDNLSSPNKWLLTEDLIIQPHGFAIIWTDGLGQGNHTGFKLSATGEQIGLFSPSLKLMDTLSFKIQKVNISSGRSIDGAGIWGSFLQPTPGASNSGSVFYTDFVKNSVVFSLRGGIYESPQLIELSAPLGGTIRYTLDGSEPNVESPVFSPFTISSNTILRARVFKEGMIPGPVSTNSYFLDDDLKSRHLPVVSIATEPANFWDPVRGIYVQNYKPLWEIPANIELFENNGSDRAAFNEQVGIKVNGLYSWQLPQKMLGIYFDSDYGNSILDYHLLFHKDRKQYKDFALRASGNDWSNTLFRDMLGQDASRLNTKLDFMDFRPSVVFVNGEYMGIHNIREKVDADFIEKNHNMAPGSFDLIENEDFAEAGDLIAYTELNGLLTKNMTYDENYKAVADVVDIENLTDLVITEMATGNVSISHNIMAWKPKDSGKWKWVIMDLDRGFFDPTSSMISFYAQQYEWPFRELMNNAGYREYFAKRLADQLYTTYNQKRMKELIESHARDIENEIPFHVNRWLGATSYYGNAIPSFDYWVKEVAKLKGYVEERPYLILSDLKNYGFNGLVNLGFSVYPSGSGVIQMNGLKIPEDNWNGPYLKAHEIAVKAEDKGGYHFLGWKCPAKNYIIQRGSEWKYLDNGSDQGTVWKDSDFDDTSWKNGVAQFGYGESDEATLINYGGNKGSKYATTYFRRKFILPSEPVEGSRYMLSLLKDDGAIVYINGTEVLRSNIPFPAVNYNTLAYTSISGDSENKFINYFIDPKVLKSGVNTISVEIHLVSRSSSDLSFDLELLNFDLNTGNYLSSEREMKFTLDTDTLITAVYEADSQCMLPSLISGEVTLGKDCSPYIVNEDVVIEKGATLKIEAGVELHMSPKVNFIVEGKINANGSESERIIFRANPDFPGNSWGNLSFVNSEDTSELKYVTIEDASEGPLPVRDYAAVSAFHSNLRMDHLIIEKVSSNPIVSRYSDIVLTNSSLHSEVSGDLINTKYGTSRIENCTFRGNAKVDCDGIDYDGIKDGIIRNCYLYNFLGYNSDAVDIGELTSNLLIENISVFTTADKGVSVGQNSSATINNSLFVNCNLGLGLKDLSTVSVNKCSFYGNGISISCYEKNPGSAGGTAAARNCILSNSSESSFYYDTESSLSIKYSLSDNTELPQDDGNIFGNPLFNKPSMMDFSLAATSPVILSGNENGHTVNMGSSIFSVQADPLPEINMIFLNSQNSNVPEFIRVGNPTDKTLDFSGYSITKGFTFVFPEGCLLLPQKNIYLTLNRNSDVWSDFTDPVYQWTDGKLSTNGESLELAENHNLIIDHLDYVYGNGWPIEAFTEGMIMVLKNIESDNHFGENWRAESLENLFNPEIINPNNFNIYPNPTTDIVYLKIPADNTSEIYIYSMTGSVLGVYPKDTKQIELSKFGQGILFIRLGNETRKVVVLK